MAQRRLPHSQDLLIGSMLVVFFVLFGLVICFSVVQPVAFGERALTLAVGVLLGFIMLVGAVRVAHFRSDEVDADLEIGAEYEQPSSQSGL
jgi:positive regulator of sigma E activity